jgi:putative transposase
MIRIKSLEVIEKHFKEKKNADLPGSDKIPDFLMERFSNWLNSYTKSFNKVYNRKGSLFIDYMRRIEIVKETQFRSTIFYIHKNPVHHGYCKSIEEWPWSSYKEYIYNKPKIISPQEILLEFETLEEFIKFHQQPIELETAAVIE